MPSIGQIQSAGLLGSSPLPAATGPVAPAPVTREPIPYDGAQDALPANQVEIASEGGKYETNANGTGRRRLVLTGAGLSIGEGAVSQGEMMGDPMSVQMLDPVTRQWIDIRPVHGEDAQYHWAGLNTPEYQQAWDKYIAGNAEGIDLARLGHPGAIGHATMRADLQTAAGLPEDKDVRELMSYVGSGEADAYNIPVSDAQMSAIRAVEAANTPEAQSARAGDDDLFGGLLPLIALGVLIVATGPAGAGLWGAEAGAAAAGAGAAELGAAEAIGGALANGGAASWAAGYEGILASEVASSIGGVAASAAAGDAAVTNTLAGLAEIGGTAEQLSAIGSTMGASESAALAGVGHNSALDYAFRAAADNLLNPTNLGTRTATEAVLSSVQDRDFDLGNVLTGAAAGALGAGVNAGVGNVLANTTDLPTEVVNAAARGAGTGTAAAVRGGDVSDAVIGGVVSSGVSQGLANTGLLNQSNANIVGNVTGNIAAGGDPNMAVLSGVGQFGANALNGMLNSGPQYPAGNNPDEMGQTSGSVVVDGLDGGDGATFMSLPGGESVPADSPIVGGLLSTGLDGGDGSTFLDTSTGALPADSSIVGGLTDSITGGADGATFAEGGPLTNAQTDQMANGAVTGENGGDGATVLDGGNLTQNQIDTIANAGGPNALDGLDGGDGATTTDGPNGPTPASDPIVDDLVNAGTDTGPETTTENTPSGGADTGTSTDTGTSIGSIVTDILIGTLGNTLPAILTGNDVRQPVEPERPVTPPPPPPEVNRDPGDLGRMTREGEGGGLLNFNSRAVQMTRSGGLLGARP